MKISKYLLFAYLVSLIIFFIPFFWLRPGEMDLGGDNSRLYFYNPLAYLESQSLFSVSHSGLGGENASYFAIPFVLLLAFVKSIVGSPTTLISVFHGINLSLGFLFCYLVVSQLLLKEEKEDASEKNAMIITAAGILAGLYYTFSPNPIRWWGYPLLPMNLVFLNPLMFYLLLRFFLTNRMIFLFIAVLISFIFSPNFSFIGAPTFFSFFPLAGIFLLGYTKFIRHTVIPVKKLIIGMTLFVLVQSFHLIPQLASIFSPGSVSNTFIFSDAGKLEWGLKYFLATAPSIKVSYALFGLPQYTPHEFYWVMFMIFPLLLVLGFLLNKSRLYLLSAVFFLITLFFVSANITTLGLTLYALAFKIPGFSMFRVYYGQWEWAYLFFYTVFLGQALFIIFKKIKPVQRYVLLGFLAVLLIVTSWPLISGKLTDTVHWQSKNIRSHVAMDPQYEEVLAYLRTLPVDGKILTLPLNDHGYQTIKGQNDAAYIGPSTITYIASRNEFNGVVEFGVFEKALLEAARKRNTASLRDLFSLLNIKYIFYNEDPFIYGDNFPGLPYENVRKYFPDTQDGYKKFIASLGVHEVKNFSGKYHIYEFDDSSYIPHIYAANHIAFWNESVPVNPNVPLTLFDQDKRVALYDDAGIFKNYKDIFDTVMLKARNTSTIFDFFKKKEFDRFVSPTVSRKLSSLIYPLVVLKEQRDLNRFRTVDNAFIDRSIYFAEKRINELHVLNDIPVQGNVTRITDLAKNWKEPELWDLTRFKEYNFWEITLVRYKLALEKLVQEIDEASQSPGTNIISKVDVKNYLYEHKLKLRTTIREKSYLSIENKKYLSALVEEMFVDLYQDLKLDLPDISHIPYIFDTQLENQTYDLYIKSSDVKDIVGSVQVEGKTYIPKADANLDWLKLGEVVPGDKKSIPMVLSIDNVPNLVAHTQWTQAELGNIDDTSSLVIKNNALSDTSGLVRDIQGWEGNTIYAISFDYFTNDQNFLVVLHETGGSTNRNLNTAYDETIRSKEWKRFSNVVLSSKDADSAFLQITKAMDDVVDTKNGYDKKIEIKNVSVQKIYNPTIVLKASNGLKKTASPKITFRQINPSKYAISVTDATEPYDLILSQAFNDKWKLYKPVGGPRDPSLKGLFKKIAGDILQSLTNFIIPAGTKTNFLNRDTFETWGKAPIAQKTHLPVNGYANAWYIKPSDVQNQKNYTLILEMTLQNTFYGSLAISAGTVLAVMMMIGATLFIKRQ